MKRPMLLWLQFITTASLLLLLTSCDKENCKHTYTLYTPVYHTLAEVRANIKSNPPKQVKKPGKIYIYGNYIFLNELNEGIHVIDNSQPASPKNIAFINIPGNIDLAVLGNTLYADSYSDLAALDISNPLKVTAKKFLDNIYPLQNGYYMNYRSNNPDSIKVITAWLTRDTTISCEQYNYLQRNYFLTSDRSASQSLATGAGGSMARFAILNNYLYTVSRNDLSVFDISTPQDPSFASKKSLDNWTIETIYPFKNKLFIGSATGMYIYDVSSPGSPVKQAQFTHARSCDPVIADDNYAWVTLRSGTSCAGNSNQLDVINIGSITNPFLIKSYNLTNPYGLSKDGNLLFVCDGKDGLKVYDATDPANLKLIKRITDMETYDVIALNNRALVVAKEALYQFDYSRVNDIRLLSKIGLK
jgi:hypothetical protein